MEENVSGDQLSIKEARKTTVSEAVRLVNAEIEIARKHLGDIAHAEDTHPILVEGETFAKCDAQVIAAANEIAKIMLKYDYHFWATLEEDAPDGMWLAIAELVGLESVSYVDISLKPARRNED